MSNLLQNQIKEDISLLADRWSHADQNLLKPEYAFNYWIITRIYSIDEEMVPDCITEYNDGGIDCFVHYEDSKELNIIQNKYYAEKVVDSKEVSYFLKNPLSLLKNNAYKRSPNLQNIFNIAKDDPDYKINLHFFASTDKKSKDIDYLLKEANNQQHGLQCLVTAYYHGISQIHDLYYGDNYKEIKTFRHDLGTVNKGTFASIREEYKIEGYEAYYIITPVAQIYHMLLAAEKKGYSLFDKNIREYLGKNPINNGIIKTLRSKTERNNFMYYNNGITVICKSIGTNQLDTKSGLRMIPLVNPHIVNGCQTVNSIRKVLENLQDQEIENEYKNVFVMLKALVIEDSEDSINKDFYDKVVKYTNKQNAIPDKAFSSNMKQFYRLKEELRTRGFLLSVKQSDANQSKELPRSEITNLKKLANETIHTLNHEADDLSDLIIPLEKLLQVFLAFMKGGYFAFTKKSRVLKQGDEIFDELTSQIHNYLTAGNLIKLYSLYKVAENQQSKSDDKRTPIPYYVIGFLGSLIGKKEYDVIEKSLDVVFSTPEIFSEAYKYLVVLSNNYRRSYEKDYKCDYNTMTKRPIDDEILRHEIENASGYGWVTIDKWVN